MLKKNLYKHTREFLETNLPENFFLFKKSNKKQKKYFSLKADFVQKNLFRLKKISTHLKCKYKTDDIDLQHTSKATIAYAKYKTSVSTNDKFLFSLSTIKSQFEKRQTRNSDFKNKLKEKKKLSILYGNLSNKSIKKALQKAQKLSGNINENLLSILETRLDVILYRALFFSSIKSAKQWLKNNKLKVNSIFVNKTNYNIKYGDIISIPKKNRKKVSNNMINYFIRYNLINIAYKYTNNVYDKNNFIFVASNKKHDSEKQTAFPLLQVSSRFPMWDYNLVSIVCKNLLTLNTNLKKKLYFYKKVLYNEVSTTETIFPRFTDCENISVAYTAKQMSEKAVNFIHRMKIPFNGANALLEKSLNLFIKKIIEKSMNNFNEVTYNLFSASANEKKSFFLKKNEYTVTSNKTFAVTDQKLMLKQKNIFKNVQINKIGNTFLKNNFTADIASNSKKECLRLYNTYNFCTNTKLNIYKCFCKLHFSVPNVLFNNFFKNIYNYLNVYGKKKKIIVTSSQYIENIYLSHYVNGLLLKKFFIFKNVFKQKHRYIIPTIYFKILKNQIKLSNSFLLKNTIDIVSKNYLVYDISRKIQIIPNICFKNIFTFKLENNLKKICKVKKNLCLYENRLNKKFNVLISKINYKCITEAKNILNALLNNKSICLSDASAKKLIHAKTKVENIHYYDFLFFLKLKSFFLKQIKSNNLPMKTNIKPLNLEVCYKTLTIIFLYPPQKLVFPCSLDIELLLRYDI